MRRTAKGLRFHRELHGMMGIWMYVIFIAVSFSGMALAWPQLMGMPNVGPNARPAPVVEALEGATPIGADAALALVKAKNPDMTLRNVMVPQPRAISQGQPITVSFFAHGAVNATAPLPMSIPCAPRCWTCVTRPRASWRGSGRCTRAFWARCGVSSSSFPASCLRFSSLPES